MSDLLQQQAENNKILEIVSGSYLYGTTTPESDKDLVGIFMPPAEYVLGLKNVNEIDLSQTNKDKAGKNTKDAINRKLYEYRKFIRLALENNPNILEILFVNPENIVNINKYGVALLEIRHLFPSKQCVSKFLGYAQSQKHKMAVRRDHFNELMEGHRVLDEWDCIYDKTTMAEVFNMGPQMPGNPTGIEEPPLVFFKKPAGCHIYCGDICFEPGVYVKKARRKLKERIDKATNRTKLILKYGYDVRFASHLIRLLTEGLTLLRLRRLSFPLSNRETILDIKLGKWNIKEVLEYAEYLESEYAQAEQESTLPKLPDYNKIEKFTIDNLREFLG